MCEENSRKKVSIEEGLRTLEALIDRLESGDCPLEESFRLYKEGVTMVSELSGALKAVEDQLILLNGESE